MTYDEIKNQLNSVMTTLNSIPVAGYEFRMRMVGCEQVLQNIISQISSMQSTISDKE